MPHILRISLASKTSAQRELKGLELLLGGRALTARIVQDEVPATCNALGRHNRLVFAGGALAGTLVSSVNRLSIGAKSPLTGGSKESNAGGVVAYKLGRLGIRAVIFEDRLSKEDGWMVVRIDAKGVSFLPAADLAGLGVYEKAKRLFERHGKDAGLALIGPAGEQHLICAGVAVTDPEGAPTRYSGRGGLGAVMASKGILAVVVDDSQAPKEEFADRNTFMALQKQVAESVNATPITCEVFRKYGTASMLNVTNNVGALPVRNFSRGVFERAREIGPETLHDTIVARGGEGRVSHACMRGCLVQCSNVYPDANGHTLVTPLEYEAIGLLGSNCGIGDLDDIARLNYYCNDMGVDTIDIGAAIAVAMEAGLAPFGDVGFAQKVITGIAEGDILSRLIGSGVEVTGKVLGVYRTPSIKGQALAAYDPRAIKGTGVTYATSPQGGDHTAGNTPRLQIKQHEKEGQVGHSRNAQQGMAFIDSLGICMMLGGAIKDQNILLSLINARFGSSFTLDEAKKIAMETLAVERKFNAEAGISTVHDRAPEFFYEEVNPDSNSVFDFTVEELASVHG
ncbi:MAG: aldehyde ferredoxin oxidoreductase [Betaproteobacteria bacterium]|nr:aldehyde ferredoxin oxidoreductase [Betaproteobacteria bacterium]